MAAELLIIDQPGTFIKPSLGEEVLSGVEVVIDHFAEPANHNLRDHLLGQYLGKIIAMTSDHSPSSKRSELIRQLLSYLDQREAEFLQIKV